ncbi:MAG: Lsr2 family protein [Williamsia herbipolensis]|uniref:Lsr2 protein n=1 Tax=Williamsia serinedens TaxID=391736 RepID=A0ABT1H2P7_9NOCA|nr:histone-like nucleoid-structuring protein Lsr2 [Williamsia serinedens]MBE7160642.1 Lsr2 family protein [Williamsia herbipolensis]MCP2161037.1 Lsr2 protein [Williamsia serinedens]
MGHIDEVGEAREARAHDETIRYGFDGVEYALTVSAEEAARFRAEIEPYLRASRPVRARRAG